MSSSGTKSFLLTIKHLGFLSLVFLSCNATQCMHGGYLALFMWSCGNWGSGNWGKNAGCLVISVSNKALYL